MRRAFKRAISSALVLAMCLSLGTFSAGAEELDSAGLDSKTVEAYMDEIRELYASGTGSVGRVHKMQAFIMELAVHAKLQSPDFKIIPQDGIDLAL